MLMHYVTFMVDVNAVCYLLDAVKAVCYLHGGCYCSLLLAWWMLMQYVTCMVDVNAVCYLHDACYSM